MDAQTDADRTAQGRKLASKCYNCYKLNSSSTPLKNCARCKMAKYCSRECHSAHWKTHKEVCSKNAQHAEALKNPANPYSLIPLPDGLTLSEYDQRLEKWIHFHNSTFLSAVIHALELPRDIKRAQSHFLRMVVGPRPREQHKGQTGRYFRVVGVSVHELEEGMGWEAPWPESLVDLGKLRDEQEKVKGRGTVAAVAILCPPLTVQMVPFGSLKDLFRITIMKDWKEILMKEVESGKR